nr:MAG TPA: voltage-gated sodium channel protein [Herelleviridae sp.]
MARLLFILLIIFLFIFLVYKLGSFLFKYLENYYKKKEIKERRKELELEIDFKEFELEQLQKQTGSISQVKELEDELNVLKQLHKDIKEGKGEN